MDLLVMVDRGRRSHSHMPFRLSVCFEMVEVEKLVL